MTKYARDEFDRVPESSTRQGVHRAVTEARRRSLVPILSLGGIALVIGLVAFIFLPQLGFAPVGDATLTASGASASASPHRHPPRAKRRRPPRRRAPPPPK